MSKAVDPGYRHYPKRASPGELLAMGTSRLKWYDLAPANNAVPKAFTADARAFLSAAHADGSLLLDDDRGFVILHRCGDSF